LVADRASKHPFPRSDAVAERVLAAAKERGLLLYSSTGFVDGTDGDLVMFGPPFVITDEQIEEAVAVTAEAIAATLPG
jgi:adenosylmethionine-8-amino-7-oxononanoate aminotransferase